MMKKFLPTSLIWRTSLIILIPVLILQIAVAFVFFERHWSKMTERLAYAVTGEMIAAAKFIEQAPDIPDRDLVMEQIMKDSVGLEVHFYEDKNHVDDHDFVYLNGFFSNPFETIEKDLSAQLRLRSDFKFHIVTVPLQKLVIVDLYVNGGILEFKIPEGRLYSSSSYIFILWMIGMIFRDL